MKGLDTHQSEKDLDTHGTEQSLGHRRKARGKAAPDSQQLAITSGAAERVNTFATLYGLVQCTFLLVEVTVRFLLSAQHRTTAPDSQKLAMRETGLPGIAAVLHCRVTSAFLARRA